MTARLYLNLLKYLSAFSATKVLPDTKRSSTGRWFVMQCIGIPNIDLMLQVFGLLKRSKHKIPNSMDWLWALSMVFAVLSDSKP